MPLRTERCHGRGAATGRAVRLVGLALAVLVLGTATHANAVYYRFVDSRPLCFVEVIDNVRESQITGVYNWKESASSPASQVGLRLSAKDATGNVYHDKPMKEGEHSFAIILGPNVMSGEQYICITAADKFVATEKKAVIVHIELDQARKGTTNPDKLAAQVAQQRKQIDGLDVYTFQDVGGELKDILHPRAYLQKIDGALAAMEQLLDTLVAELSAGVQKESRMRETSESTFTRVWVCAILLIGVISGVLWMQFRFLKTTLRKKKLV